MYHAVCPTIMTIANFVWQSSDFLMETYILAIAQKITVYGFVSSVFMILKKSSAGKYQVLKNDFLNYFATKLA